MKILVIGGTGRERIRQGLEQGQEVTVLARKPSRVKAEHPRLKVLKGNVLHVSALEEALGGQEAVLCALGHKRFILPTSTLSRGTQNILDVMQRKGVNRFLCITSLGIGDSRFRLGLYYTLFTIPFILFFYFKDKSKQEDLIRKSGLDWTIVRPGQLTNGKKRARYRHGPGLGHYIFTRMISRADVAHFMLRELEKDRYIRSVTGITY